MAKFLSKNQIKELEWAKMKKHNKRKLYIKNVAIILYVLSQVYLIYKLS